MRLIGVALFIVIFLFFLLDWALGVFYIPQQTQVTYVNEKYAYNGTAYITRYGRKSTYFYNIQAGIKHVWGNNITSIRIIPERTEVTYANEKYMYNVSSHVIRYGRKSTYYYNLEGGIRHVWGNNITMHLSFFEAQNNQYRRSFLEVQLKLCDMLQHDQYFGKMFATILAGYGVSCPFLPGMYHFLNVTLSSDKLPNILSFQKGKVEMKLNQLPTQDSIRIIPERTEVTYANEKYMYNVSAHVIRYGRKSTYYYNLEGGIRHVWGNNITMHLSFFEAQNNQYRRSFLEVQLKLCDMLQHDQYFGKMFATILAGYGVSCPFLPGMYHFLNVTLSSDKLPNILSFQKGKVEMKLNQLPTQDVIASMYTIFHIQPT